MALSLQDDLRGRGFKGAIEAGAALAPLTTWRIGGPADVLATPTDRDDAVMAVAWARDREIPLHVLGNGSNLLVRDEGVRGLVLRVRKVLNAYRIRGRSVVAGAGASFPGLANLVAGHGLAGLEFAAGIPGTVGGAIVMNAGWHEHETRLAVTSVEFLEDDGTATQYGPASCRFGYRTSAFRGRRGVVLGAEFSLTPEDPAVVKERLDAFAAHRKATQPTELPSCGSVYLKPEGDFAGRLIEAAGLKGHRLGALQVSPKHANFFVNLGGGSAGEVLALAELVEATVRERLGVALTREFEVW